MTLNKAHSFRICLSQVSLSLSLVSWHFCYPFTARATIVWKNWCSTLLSSQLSSKLVALSSLEWNLKESLMQQWWLQFLSLSSPTRSLSVVYWLTCQDKFHSSSCFCSSHFPTLAHSFLDLWCHFSRYSLIRLVFLPSRSSVLFPSLQHCTSPRWLTCQISRRNKVNLNLVINSSLLRYHRLKHWWRKSATHNKNRNLSN